MKFRKMSVVAATIMTTGLLSASLWANAADLTWTNNTNVDLSVQVNNVCSSQFGVIAQHTQKVITEANLKQACNNKHHCAIKVFNKPNCRGTHVETIVVNLDSGIVGLEGGDDDRQGNRYDWQADRFNLSVSTY